MADQQPTPAEQARQLYEDTETRTAKAMESLVAQDSFGELLARVSGNLIALTKIGTDAADLVVGNLRIAGRRDVIGLQKQLARTEDKLERVLQEVERLQDEVAAAREGATGNGRAAGSSGTRRGRGSGSAKSDS